LGIFAACCIVREAEIEGRAMCDRPASRRHDVITPSLSPSLFDVVRQAGRVDRRQSFSEQGSKHPVNQPPRAAVNQWEGGCHDCMIGRLQANFLRQREAQHHSRLAVIRERLPCRTVDQPVEIGQTAQRFASDGAGECRVGRRKPSGDLRGIVHRLSAAQDSIQYAKCRLAGVHPILNISGWTWHCAL
jgi:hypothetical protein